MPNRPSSKAIDGYGRNHASKQAARTKCQQITTLHRRRLLRPGNMLANPPEARSSSAGCSSSTTIVSYAMAETDVGAVANAKVVYIICT